MADRLLVTPVIRRHLRVRGAGAASSRQVPVGRHARHRPHGPDPQGQPATKLLPALISIRPSTFSDRSLMHQPASEAARVGEARVSYHQENISRRALDQEASPIQADESFGAISRGTTIATPADPITRPRMSSSTLDQLQRPRRSGQEEVGHRLAPGGARCRAAGTDHRRPPHSKAAPPHGSTPCPSARNIGPTPIFWTLPAKPATSGFARLTVRPVPAVLPKIGVMSADQSRLLTSPTPTIAASLISAASAAVDIEPIASAMLRPIGFTTPEGGESRSAAPRLPPLRPHPGVQRILHRSRAPPLPSRPTFARRRFVSTERSSPLRGLDRRAAPRQFPLARGFARRPSSPADWASPRRTIVSARIDSAPLSTKRDQRDAVAPHVADRRAGVRPRPSLRPAGERRRIPTRR